jgi:peroxiredoxin
MFMLTSANLNAQTSLDTAVNFTIKDVDGVTHRLDEYLSQQKIVVIDFFTITCGPCTT